MSLTTEKWQMIPVAQLKTLREQAQAHRLNALGNLYYFTKFVLRKHRLVEHLHRPICTGLEASYIKDIYEIPRDHFKSTICSESLPMWWALPLTDKDINIIQLLGYSDEFIKYLQRVHNQNTRTLLVSEVIDNAIKLGSRIDQHYKNNDLFRSLFPEIQPDSSCVWNAHSMTHKRTRNVSPQGEGTYDVIGVGGALQSRHYDRIVQDDLVGRKAANSDVVMDDTINYHKLLVGAFDSDPTRPDQSNDELVVGNRWSWRDLNSWIRENEPYFRIVNHSALGGCCPAHQAGQPIFPEEFTVDKLNEFHKRLGTYEFSCQFLNNPTPPGDTFFKEEWLRHYNLEMISINDRRAQIVHEVKQGEVIPNNMPGNLRIGMACDPNHAGNAGRCRHAITVTGLQQNPLRVYLLEVWAEACSTEKFVAKIYQLAERWKLKEVWLETIAAQKYLKVLIDYRNKIEGRKLAIKELKSERSANAKAQRIEALEPIFENGWFWSQRFGQEEFRLEYLSYPHGKTKDILDTLGYAPQTWKIERSAQEIQELIKRNQQAMKIPSYSNTGY
jgi:hypothetical protein